MLPVAKPQARARTAAKPAHGAATRAESVTKPAAAGESAKQRILFQLMRTRAALHAAIHGLTAEAAAQPLGEGKWNAREVVLHLVLRDRARLREIEGALRGVRASWEGYTNEQMDRANAEGLAALGHSSWEEAVELLNSTREALLDDIGSVPEEPAEVWRAEHAFGWMLHGLPKHDAHHAEAIQRWRAEHGV